MTHPRLISGAYIISNKKTGTCIELEDDVKNLSLTVQDHQGRRQQQIWWVEALPDHASDIEDGAVYCIRNVYHYLERGLDSWPGNKGKVISAVANGMGWQKWRIKRAMDDENREFYNIMSVHDGGALGFAVKSLVKPPAKASVPIPGNSESFKSPILESYSINMSAFFAAAPQQLWEFIIPTVAIPPGWVQIINVSPDNKRRILQQKYLTSPPFLGPEIDPASPLSERSNWGSQWAFFLEYRTNGLPQHYWTIRNRLTHAWMGFREETQINGREINIIAGEVWDDAHYSDTHLWKLQMHRDRCWSIINKKNGLALARAESVEAGEVQAVENSGKGSDRRRWEFL
ncbi:hypothetical protein RUND412_001542 [Rhizina undulata]